MITPTTKEWGWTLAKAHTPSDDRRAISSCIGEPKGLAIHVCESIPDGLSSTNATGC